MCFRSILNLILVIVLVFTSQEVLAEEKQIQPAKVALGRPTSFEKDILPIFKTNCLACHSKAKNEGSLILEDYKSLMKGGDSGESIIPGKPDESYLYQVSARLEESFMPPLPNPSAAKALTPKQLGTLRLWIQEGAKSSGIKEQKKIVWHPIPEGLKSIYSMSLSPWAQFVAVGRTNRVFLYDLSAGKLISQLNDPQLSKLKLGNSPFYPNGATQRDFVNSIAISPDGKTIATGGFRNIKLWKKQYKTATSKITHTGKIKSFAVSKSSPIIGIQTEDNHISVWNSKSGEKISELNDLKSNTVALEVSPDGKKIVTGSESGEIKIFQVIDGKEIASYQSKSKVNAILFDTKSMQLFSGHEDGVLRAWTGDKKKQTVLFELKGSGKPVKSLNITSDGTKLFSSADEEYVRSWDLKTKKQLRAYRHGAVVSGFSLSPNNQFLVTVSTSGLGKIWQIKDGKILGQFKGRISKQREALVATDKSVIAKQQVALADTAVKAAEKKVKGREAENKKLIEEEAAAKKAVPVAKKKKDDAEKIKIAVIDELAKVISDHKKKGADALQAAKVRKTNIDQVIAKANLAKKNMDDGVSKAIADLSASISATEKKIATFKALKVKKEDQEAVKEKQKDISASEAELKTLKEKLNNVKLKRFAYANKFREEMKKNNLELVKAQRAIDSANQLVASKPNTKTADKKVKTAEGELKKLTDEFKKAERQVVSKGRAIKASSKTLANNKKRLEVLKGQKKTADSIYAKSKTIQTQANKDAGSLIAFRNVLFSKDGSKVISNNGTNEIQFWDAKNGNGLGFKSIGDSPMTNLKINHQGEIVSLSNNQSLSYSSLDVSWQLISRFGVSSKEPLDISESPIVGRVQSLDFSPDGKFLAAGTGEPSRNGTIIIWDLETGKLFKELSEAHSDTISGLKFSNDSTKILSGATDKLAKIFDVVSGKQIVSFEGHTHHVLGVSWKADGSKVATSGADNVIKTWNVSTGEVERTITGYSKQVPSVTYIGTGDNILSGSGDKNVRLHLSTNGRVVRSFSGSTDYIYCVDTSRDGKIVVAGGADGVLRVWDGTNGKTLHTFNPPDSKKIKTASK